MGDESCQPPAAEATGAISPAQRTDAERVSVE
jgi:hypothetical protein